MTISSVLNCLCNFVRNQLFIYVYVFFLDYFLSLVYLFILMPKPHCLNNCNCIISLEIWQCQSSNFVLCLSFFYYFRYCWGSVIALTLQISMRRIYILLLSLLINEQRIISPFIQILTSLILSAIFSSFQCASLSFYFLELSLNI